jgi:hypothetical protein
MKILLPLLWRLGCGLSHDVATKVIPPLLKRSRILVGGGVAIVISVEIVGSFYSNSGPCPTSSVNFTLCPSSPESSIKRNTTRDAIIIGRAQNVYTLSQASPGTAGSNLGSHNRLGTSRPPSPSHPRTLGLSSSTRSASKDI